MGAQSDRPRIIGIDLLRSLTFLSIIGFHCGWIFWRQPAGPPRHAMPTPLWELYSDYIYLLGFSGFAIVLLTSFLFAWQGPKSHKKNWLLVYLFGGWVIFNGLLALRDHGTYRWVWDVYPLLAMGLYSIYPYLQRDTDWRLDFFLFLCSLVLLASPFWHWQIYLSAYPFLQEILLGRCPEDYADWPLLPWLGLIWAASFAGHRLRQYQAQAVVDLSFRLWELPFWTACVGAFLFNFGAYNNTPAGDAWACYMYRLPWTEPFSHLAGVAFALRLSFHPAVQSFLTGQAWARWLSHCSCNRHFYIAYLWHYALIFFWAALREKLSFADEAWFWDLSLVLLLFLTEYGTRLCVRLVKALSNIRRQPAPQ